jgi:hypothetical protein
MLNGLSVHLGHDCGRTGSVIMHGVFMDVFLKLFTPQK